MDAGLAAAGFQHRWFCELDPYARSGRAVESTYQRRWLLLA